MESPLQVKLAGFNVDVDAINEAKANLNEGYMSGKIWSTLDILCIVTLIGLFEGKN